MNEIAQRLDRVNRRIKAAEELYNRPPGSTRLLAVSKTRTADEIREAVAAGQHAFGESYLQEALDKHRQLQDLPLEWHFIGRIQGNKTKPIAEWFDWVHSLGSLKHARRLNQQRPPGLAPLKACIQINTSGEASKGGHSPDELLELLPAYTELPRIQIAGLMTLPAPADSLDAQRKPFRQLRELRDRLRRNDLPLETLSIGMSADLEAAIAEGSTIVRIGTAIFGPRQTV
ncbi:YggS family pyridoxal phosphate-dependent enzyme [endosymbiont of Ridgeia piscesae]|jgi:pyridoxal phosphate enzyme (YggS family)|uniref:Pyridoxal phosphate homeostasis protein n=1 Tax=endosymbiont of Ridgeia piscesae TaxID=54398 RepID=A0A0T5YXJ2_9GAMM|nr:YggS family pyridoxal phosphate-dependent enzyme [endosymbiont of Ridgeia piscesae]KRT55369.1 pyridoxal phosphate enzyme, YggS family [endosymbiont of Ridgeia piscesae]KRT57872.1 hypothetical protein Ga0076813_12483 [endosymbiont of Ridgeia piscesae]